jgi:hypothetical protein
MRPTNRSGGRQPAVVLELHRRAFLAEHRCWHATGGLRPPLLVGRAFVHRKSRHFTGTRSGCTKSGGRQPAVVLELHRRAFLAEHGCWHATGGLTPPAPGWTCVRTSQKSPFHRHTFGLHYERRASARRGSVNRTLPGENHARFGDDATDAQERRASARRGSVNRTLPGENRARFGDDATDAQERRASARRGVVTHLHRQAFFANGVTWRTTAGLRQPLLVAARANVIANMRFAPTSTLLFPRLAYASRS